jgi:phospholipid/cholesterol/gamma-HCH transport system substrate-binding protein
VKRDNVNYLLAGAFVLAALGALFWVMLKLTGRSGATDAYVTYYERVGGVRVGSPVFFEGFRVGQVEAIEPLHQGSQTRFKLSLGVERGWPIPSDSRATLASSGLLADVFIGISEGTATTVLKPGAEIPSEEGADLFAAVGSLAREVQNLSSQKLSPLVDLLSTRIDALTADLSTEAPAIIRDTREILTKLKSSATSMDTLLSADNRGQVEQFLRNMNQTSENTKALTDDLAAARGNLRSLIAELDGAAKENRPHVRQLVRDLRLSMEALSSRIDSVTYHLEAASRNVNEFSQEIRRQPNLLIFTPPKDETKADAAAAKETERK